MTLAEMQIEVSRVNHAKGWYDDERSFGDLISLLHSELSEALEAFRTDGTDDLTAEPGLFENLWRVIRRKPVKPEGVGSEFADVLIRLLDAAERYGIDLDAEYRRKVDYNETRPYRHGGKRL
jgi:NTP pyrophosphatase (non-canonical NTP hydrolase)